MKRYDFDELIDRRGTDCLKVDGMKKAYGVDDAVPMWVADMDFRTPDFVLEAIRQRCTHEILGYTFPSDNYYQSIVDWVTKRHHWKIEKEYLTFLPGVVPGLAHCLNAFTKPGDKVLIQTPVYMPFHWVPDNLHREVVNNYLFIEEGRFAMDFSSMEKEFNNGCKTMILCNPHNPGGRVWSPEELMQLSDLCEKYGVLVLSDEIHADLTLNGAVHTPFASLSEYAFQHTITLMAPSKTFNLAGLATSFSVIGNPALRSVFVNYLHATELNNGTIFAYVAAQAAYENGTDWVRQLTDYVWENVLLVRDFLSEQVPHIHPMIPDATYMVWLDCRELGMSQKELRHFFYQEAKVVMNDGTAFGPGGEGFMRMNLATPRSNVLRALEGIKCAFDKLGE
ncbi:MAG: PatB family C-S lyase [Bacteroidales bacterium]|nr:PatB family C-S lyase [Bacteroidales bacterium]